MSPDALAHLLLPRLRARVHASPRPFVLGISGLQGSGKSTLAAHLVANAPDLATVSLSLDDFYYTRAERQELAARVHPLLATRGVPGTHDLALLHATLDALAHTRATRPAHIPRFDKAEDDRLPADQWTTVPRPPRLIVLEGWCLDLPPQPQAALREPVNALERDADPDGRWRRYVNAQLAGPYAAVWQRLDYRVLLQAPGFEVVMAWRGQQERELALRHPSLTMDADALAHFIAHYERLSRHAHAVLPARADAVVVLDARRVVLEVRWRHGAEV